MADGVYEVPSASLSSFTVQYCVSVCGCMGMRMPVCMLSKHFLPSGHRGHVPRKIGLLPVFYPDTHGNVVNLDLDI